MINKKPLQLKNSISSSDYKNQNNYNVIATEELNDNKNGSEDNFYKDKGDKHKKSNYSLFIIHYYLY